MTRDPDPISAYLASPEAQEALAVALIDNYDGTDVAGFCRACGDGGLWPNDAKDGAADILRVMLEKRG